MTTPRRTVHEVLLYEYAKLIADRRIGERDGLAPVQRIGPRYWQTVNRTFQRLKAGEIQPSSILRENKLLLANSDRCAYCDATGKLQWEHLIPRASGGPDTMDNLVKACGPCNGSKGARHPVDWYDARGLDRAHIPRLVMGKLLKLWMEEHRRLGTLDATEFPTGEPVRFRGVRLVFGAAS